jgi:hypothetical protein
MAAVLHVSLFPYMDTNHSKGGDMWKKETRVNRVK